MEDLHENIIDVAAQAAHEANRVWCIANGDTSQVHWEEAADWQRHSAREGVRGVLNGNTPEESQLSWLAMKETEGWVYGPAKDISTKTHPCMVSYDQLPEADRMKDHIFVGVVQAF